MAMPMLCELLIFRLQTHLFFAKPVNKTRKVLKKIEFFLNVESEILWMHLSDKINNKEEKI